MATLRGLGSASVGRHVLSELDVQGAAHAFEAWVPAEWPGDIETGLVRSRLHRVQAGLGAKFFVENRTIRGAIRRGEVERLFSLGDTSLPWPGLPHLLLVQQAYLAYEPEDWGFQAPLVSRAKMAAMAAYFRAGLAGATRLTVQTEDMKARLAARWGLNGDRIAVVPSALGPVWEALATTAERAPPAGRPTVCYPAGPAVHKNHGVLVPMLRALAARVPDVRLLLTASRAALPGLVEAAGAAKVLDRIEFRGAVAAGDLPGLVTEATVVVVPALLESFGLTYYEAMAAGIPVVASDRAFAREALGDAGHYAAPNDGEALADAVLPLLEGGIAWRSASRAARARYLAVRWTWPQVATCYLSLLERLA